MYTGHTDILEITSYPAQDFVRMISALLKTFGELERLEARAANGLPPLETSHDMIWEVYWNPIFRQVISLFEYL